MSFKNKKFISEFSPLDIPTMKRVNVLIDLHLWKAMKLIAKRKRKLISVIYKEAIECYLDSIENYGWDHENK